MVLLTLGTSHAGMQRVWRRRFSQSVANLFHVYRDRLSTTWSLAVGDNWGSRRSLFSVITRTEWFRTTCRIFWCLHMPPSCVLSCSINRVQGTFDAERLVCPLVHFMARMLAYETRFRPLYVCWWIPKNFSFPLLFSESLYTRFYCKIQVRFS